MKVGVNARTFSVAEPGGAVQSSIQLTTELVENTDHEVILFGSEGLSEQFNVSVESFGFRDSQAWGILWERLVLPRLATNTDLDVLYCPNGNAPLRDIGIPVVMCVHDVNAQKGMSSGVHQAYRRLAVPLSTRRCNAIVTVSKFSRQEILQHLPVQPERVHVIYNGIDQFYLSQTGSRPMELPDEYILYVGAINPRKNVRKLVKAYEGIRKDIPHELVLIGPGNKSMFKNMDIDHLSQDIITPGFVPREQLKYAYEHATVFVYPSLYEGFGLPPLEAMACGTPVVASDINCFSEILDDSAVLIDPHRVESIGEGIKQLIENEEKANTFKYRGYDRVENFTWKKTCNRLVNVFEEVVEQ